MLPDAEDLPELLLDLAVPHEDINELIALRRTVTGDPGSRRLLAECVDELFRGLDEPGRDPGLDERLAEAPRSAHDTFAAFVFLAAHPHTVALHRERGIPAGTTRRTLADLGRQMAVHRRRHGSTGLRSPRWLARHFRGEVYQLGRLQFERARLGERTAAAVAANGVPARPGTACLNLHIPDFRGPLTPAACDRSLEQARDFFPLHFPEEQPVAAVCHSWLLDRQLRNRLPADSHIVRFQKRFGIAHEDTGPADTEPVQFVFGDPGLPVAGLPGRTSVERAVRDHLLAGGHWYIGHGWFPLPLVARPESNPSNE
ncbi:acyltransferase domain-containing protein [Streptomyces sp. NPDC005573]|uniref:acyltransferase domain-containing protein n=1 Tax=Streptomyces sp. NPDC005573 TaxID=3156890 RepID=UPI0033A293CB